MGDKIQLNEKVDDDDDDDNDDDDDDADELFVRNS